MILGGQLQVFVFHLFSSQVCESTSQALLHYVVLKNRNAHD